MANYALLKSTDYVDVGKLGSTKSDAAPPRNGENRREAKSKKPEKPANSEELVAEAGLEPARELTPPRILSPVRLPFRHSAKVAVVDFVESVPFGIGGRIIQPTDWLDSPPATTHDDKMPSLDQLSSTSESRLGFG